MLGYEDMEVRAFDLKMRLLAESQPMNHYPTFLKVEREVDGARRNGVEIKLLRLGYGVWEDLHEDWELTDRLFGYEVEVVDEDHDLIDVVETADVLELVAA